MNHLLMAMRESVVERLEQEAAANGLDPGILLLQIMVEGLPVALADAARDLLTGPKATAPPDLPAARRGECLPNNAVASLPPARLESEDGGGGST